MINYNNNYDQYRIQSANLWPQNL